VLTRLEVDGFKSLRDFAVDLEPFTVFIGPNSAGKSNILEAIALLSRLAHASPVDALQRGRGLIIDQFTRHRDEHVTDIRLALECIELDDAVQTRFRAELDIRREVDSTGQPAIKLHSQRLGGLEEREDAWARAHPEFGRWLAHGSSGDVQLSLPPVKLVGRRPLPGIEFGAASLLEDSLDSLHIHLHASHLREPSDRLAAAVLAPDARNLPRAVDALPPPVLGQVRAALSAIVPGVASVEVVRDRDLLSLEFVLSGGERIPARIASDGTLRVLALLTAAFSPHGPRILCIEEPENGVYPRRLRDLLNILHERTRPTEDARLPPQILVTTHSPVAIAALRDAPECVRFVDAVRRNGQRVTRVRKLATGTASGPTAVAPREIEDLLDLGVPEDDA
jgi:predicted ATPase